jgi:PleD family two-component response regulator
MGGVPTFRTGFGSIQIEKLHRAGNREVLRGDRESLSSPTMDPRCFQMILGEGTVSEHLFALLVHTKTEPFEALRETLHRLSVETFSVENCQQVHDLISQCKPHIIFTERWLADGSWLTISDMAEAAQVPVSVIVVAPVPDTRLYLSVMERGAFDLVAPPFEHEPLSFVVRSAALSAHQRREAQMHATMH